MTRHQERTHPVYVAGCYACRISTVQLTPSAMPTRTTTAVCDYDFQKGFAKEFENGDREAYRRLRQNGLQPPRIAGSAHLERHATTRFEVESGVVSPEPRKLRDALAFADDSGFDPLTPATAPKVQSE